jgi:hypothetical protein
VVVVTARLPGLASAAELLELHVGAPLDTSRRDGFRRFHCPVCEPPNGLRVRRPIATNAAGEIAFVDCSHSREQVLAAVSDDPFPDLDGPLAKPDEPRQVTCASCGVATLTITAGHGVRCSAGCDTADVRRCLGGER